MQTFLPYANFEKSLKCLDRLRLGKQRVEALQLIKVIKLKELRDQLHTGTIAWANHPATLMWEHYLPALQVYYNTSILVWTSKGYNNTMKFESVLSSIKTPPWLGDPLFHRSHRSNLLRKNYCFYSRYGWKEPNNIPYLWPISSLKGV